MQDLRVVSTKTLLIRNIQAISTGGGHTALFCLEVKELDEDDDNCLEVETNHERFQTVGPDADGLAVSDKPAQREVLVDHTV